VQHYACSVWCSRTQGSAQSRAFQFLQLNASARAAALSGAFNAVADDPNAVFF
jgi:hypothetical protein